MQKPDISQANKAGSELVLTGAKAYLLAVVVVALALVLRLAIDPVWHDRLPFGFFFLGVIVVTQATGIGPSLLAIVGGFLLGDWFFIPPRHHLFIQQPVYRLNAALFFAICLAILFYSRRMRLARERERAARAEKERLIEELQKALAQVKTLTGLFPICSYCKKIRDDKGYWNQIESYLREHSSANFTHSICPECAQHNYADFMRDEPQSP